MTLSFSGGDTETEKKRFEQAKIDVIYSFFYTNQPFFLRSHSHTRLLLFSFFFFFSTQLFFFFNPVSHGASLLTWLIIRTSHLLTGKVLTIIYSTLSRFERSKSHGRWWSCLHRKLEASAEISQLMGPWAAVPTCFSAPQSTTASMDFGTAYPQSGQCCSWIHTHHPPQSIF